MNSIPMMKKLLHVEKPSPRSLSGKASKWEKNEKKEIRQKHRVKRKFADMSNEITSNER